MDQRLPGIRPRLTIWRRLDITARHAFPAVCVALVMLVFSAPLGLPGQPEIQAAVALSCVFFWSVFRPDSMPPPAVFALGVFADLLGYAPPGVNVLVLLVAHGLALRWRRVLMRQGFLMVWLTFVSIAVGAATVQWMLTALLTFKLLPLGPALFQAELTAGLYPGIAVLLSWAHGTLAEPGHA